ncbi:hypothetical protein Tco_0465673 [Tanacetum coccineum]
MGIVPTEMELILEQTQQGISHEVSISAEGVEELKRKVKIKGEKKEALLTLKAETGSIHLLFYTSAGNPIKEILLKLNLPDHRLFKDGGGVKEFQRSFRHSDTERLSQSDEVLKLKNFKKDATLKLFKSTNQERWSLDELVYGAPLEGPYKTNLPSPDDFISYIREDREGQVTRIRHKEEIEGGNRDHVLACLCYMLYCVANSEKFNLAYYMAKRMEWVTKQSRLILPYGMLLTRLFNFIMSENPKLSNESYVLYDRTMDPLGAQKERKARKDRGMTRGRHSISSYSTLGQPYSSHFNDDGDGNDEGTLRASTHSSIRYVNSLTNEVP